MIGDIEFDTRFAKLRVHFDLQEILDQSNPLHGCPGSELPLEGQLRCSWIVRPTDCIGVPVFTPEAILGLAGSPHADEYLGSRILPENFNPRQVVGFRIEVSQLPTKSDNASEGSVEGALPAE